MPAAGAGPPFPAGRSPGHSPPAATTAAVGTPTPSRRAATRSAGTSRKHAPRLVRPAARVSRCRPTRPACTAQSQERSLRGRPADGREGRCAGEAGRNRRRRGSCRVLTPLETARRGRPARPPTRGPLRLSRGNASSPARPGAGLRPPASAAPASAGGDLRREPMHVRYRGLRQAPRRAPFGRSSRFGSLSGRLAPTTGVEDRAPAPRLGTPAGAPWRRARIRACAPYPGSPPPPASSRRPSS